jgi:predicted dehydrogenase
MSVNSTAREPIRVGLIGCGGIAVAHLNGYSKRPDLGRVVALCDADEATARQRAEEYDLQAPVYADYRAMLERADVEAVDVCLPIMAHMDVCLAAVAAGRHILCEKPFTNTLAEARRVVAAAEEAGVTVMVAHNQRFRPRHLKMKQLADAGKIGRIVSARADINQNIQAILPDGHWHYHHRGALISLGVHMLDTLRYLVGDVKRVSGFFATEMMPMVGQAGVTGEEADDLGVAALEFESGALGTLAASYCARAHPWHDAIILHGTRGGMHTVGGLHLMSEVDDAFATMSPVETESEAAGDWRLGPSYCAEVEHFLHCIREGVEPMCSGRDNLRTMAVIEAVYRSGATGRTVDVGALLEEDSE